MKKRRRRPKREREREREAWTRERARRDSFPLCLLFQAALERDDDDDEDDARRSSDAQRLVCVLCVARVARTKPALPLSARERERERKGDGRCVDRAGSRGVRAKGGRVRISRRCSRRDPTTLAPAPSRGAAAGAQSERARSPKGRESERDLDEGRPFLMICD